MILKSVENKKLYEDEGQEFKNQLKIIDSLPGRNEGIVDRLSSLYEEYDSVFNDWFRSIDMPGSDQSVSTKLIGSKHNELIGFIRRIS